MYDTCGSYPVTLDPGNRIGLNVNVIWLLMFTVPPKIWPNSTFWLAMFAVHGVYTPTTMLVQFVLLEKLMS